MEIKRPDLDNIDPAVRAYIEALEAQIEQLHQGRKASHHSAAVEEPNEPPTTINVVTVSASGLIKRTPRHLYSRQRRGGMGVFDLQTPEDDPPAHLAAADEGESLIVVTDRARAFRLPLEKLPESPVNGRGQPLTALLDLNGGERPAVVFSDQGGAYVAILSQRGHVHWMAGHLLGEKLLPGTILYDIKKLGPPVAACWTPGDGDLFIATHTGQAIRFSARQVPMRGCLGIRLERDDAAVAITAVREESGVFWLGADGKGTIRLMSGFRANKSPGGGGKVALKTDHLIGAATISEDDDVFAISRLGKIIRFQATEVPLKEGVVQGVSCMALRADEVVALAVSG
ncbi:MAG: DNA gyrase C-terminal beta-propeller domain-containing protein [Chloroflexota bacterium]